MLKAEGLVVHYGGALVLNQVSLEVGEGDIVAVIGPNGAGKTTLLRTVSGLVSPTRGTIEFDGMSLHRNKPHEIVKAGVIHCPEGRKLFSRMSVIENLIVGTYLHRRKTDIDASLREIFDLFPNLEKMKHRPSMTLSGGEQQMLAIGRALMGRPKVLLLDEPSAGLAPLLRTSISEVLLTLKQRGLAILLVEQDVSMAFGVASRCYVLEGGQIGISGLSHDLAQDEHVRRAYLGL